MAAGSASPFGPLMLNQTTFNFPFPPDGAATALLIVEGGTAPPSYTLHPVTPGVLPDPFALGQLDAGATVAITVRWFGADGAQIGSAISAPFTLPSGPDSPLGLTITTRPSPVVPQVDAPVAG